MCVKRSAAAWILGMALCLSGCGNGEKVDTNEEFPADDTTKIVMDIRSWDIEVSASDDDKIHVGYEGKSKNGRVQIIQKDGMLMIQQDDGPKKNVIERFSFGKAGKITLHVPQNAKIPWEINNGSGDVGLEAAAISALSLNNDSGYIVLSGLTVENAKMDSHTGDIKITDSSFTDSDIHVRSAYVAIKNTDIDKTDILTGSGEVNMDNINAYDRLSIETDSGDISLSHKSMPDDLSYDISSGSEDITVQFQDAGYTADTDGCKQGCIGNGKNSLSIISDSGTITVK